MSITETDDVLAGILRTKLDNAESAVARLQGEAMAARQEALRWHTWVNTIIDMAPAEIRRYVTSRLDATGGAYVADGVWNYILQRTKD